jgi:hypothetical protein
MYALIIIFIIIVIIESSHTRKTMQDSINRLQDNDTTSKKVPAGFQITSRETSSFGYKQLLTSLHVPPDVYVLSPLVPTLSSLGIMFIICGNCKKSFYSKDGKECPHCMQDNPKNIYKYTNSLTTNQQRSNK